MLQRVVRFGLSRLVSPNNMMLAAETQTICVGVYPAEYPAGVFHILRREGTRGYPKKPKIHYLAYEEDARWR